MIAVRATVFRLAVLLGLGAAVPARAQAILPPDPESTLVAELLIVAQTGGPAWWKVTRGDSTVWIIGLPPAPTPVGLPWDKTALERRLRGAKLLIAPTTDWSGFAKGEHVLPLLPPDMARKVEAASALLGDPVRDDELTTVAALIPLRGAYHQFYRLDFDISPQVISAASRARVRVVAEPQVRYYWTAADIDPKDPRMVGCIDGILKDVVIDPALYQQAGEAWARGDVPTLLATAPRGAGWVCQHLFPGSWERAVSRQVEAVAVALETPGKAVAALHIPQLVAEDGVLARLKARGYTIAEPSKPLTE